MQVKAWRWSKYASRREPGERPGTIAPHPEAQPTAVDVMAYGPDSIVEKAGLTDLSDLDALRAGHAVIWINVTGLGTADTIKALGDRFGLHRLALEDVVNTQQRPKVELYEDWLLFVARMPLEAVPLRTEQFSLFLGKGVVVTFQEQAGDVFDAVRQRIRDGRPRLRRGEADYLAYALIDSLVDSYFPILESQGEFLENLEDEILDNPQSSVVPRLHHLKRDMLNLRRYVWPLRETLGALYRDELPQVTDATQLYLRDCHDHAVQLIDLVESYRDILSGLMDLYLSSVSNRMNEVMKVLTIIATLFMPLGFIAGLYGMNFDTGSPWNMPELGWRFGYPVALGAMIAVVGLFLIYFARKGWIGNRRD